MSLLPPPGWLKRAPAMPPMFGFPDELEVVGTELALLTVPGAIGKLGTMRGNGIFGPIAVTEVITFLATWADDGKGFVRDVPIRTNHDDPCGQGSGLWWIDGAAPHLRLFEDKHGLGAATIDWQPGRRAVAVQCRQTYRCGGDAGPAYGPFTITLIIAKTSSDRLVAQLDKRIGDPPSLAGAAPVPTPGYTVAQHGQAWSDWERDPARNRNGDYRPHDWQELPLPDDPARRIPERF